MWSAIPTPLTGVLRVVIPTHVQVEFKAQKFNCSVGGPLSGDGDSSNEHPCLDQEAIVVTAGNELREVHKACCKLFDNLDEFDRLEVNC